MRSRTRDVSRGKRFSFRKCLGSLATNKKWEITSALSTLFQDFTNDCGSAGNCIGIFKLKTTKMELVCKFSVRNTQTSSMHHLSVLKKRIARFIIFGDTCKLGGFQIIRKLSGPGKEATIRFPHPFRQVILENMNRVLGCYIKNTWYSISYGRLITIPRELWGDYLILRVRVFPVFCDLKSNMTSQLCHFAAASTVSEVGYSYEAIFLLTMLFAILSAFDYAIYYGQYVL